MLTVVVFPRTIGLICCGHRADALENRALRQQLAALKRSVIRPRLRASDRLFWMVLAHAWPDWRQPRPRPARNGRALASRVVAPTVGGTPPSPAGEGDILMDNDCGTRVAGSRARDS